MHLTYASCVSLVSRSLEIQSWPLINSCEVWERRMRLLQAEKGDKNRVLGLGGLGEKSSLRKYSSSTRILDDPFISSNVGPANNFRVRVSTLGRFITNAKKSSRQAKSCSNNDPELEAFLIFETDQDAEKPLLLVDL
nr:hypothetical protein [Tanacetum cinerariifolium]